MEVVNRNQMDRVYDNMISVVHLDLKMLCDIDLETDFDNLITRCWLLHFTTSIVHMDLKSCHG